MIQFFVIILKLISTKLGQSFSASCIVSLKINGIARQKYAQKKIAKKKNINKNRGVFLILMVDEFIISFFGFIHVFSFLPNSCVFQMQLCVNQQSVINSMVVWTSYTHIHPLPRQFDCEYPREMLFSVKYKFGKFFYKSHPDKILDTPLERQLHSIIGICKSIDFIH